MPTSSTGGQGQPYILEFLRGGGVPLERGGVQFDYRLLSSGELYNGNVRTADPQKSDIARILLQSPFSLVVCRSSFMDYPQELALRFTCGRVNESTGRNTWSFWPDDEIARDVAALLTLFLRRLITVAAKVRELHGRANPSEPDPFFDAAVPFVKTINAVHWQLKPYLWKHSGDGKAEVVDYNPPLLSVDGISLERALVNLPDSDLAANIVLSARLYALALVQIERDVDIAYQLLIAAVETTATEAQKAFKPPDDEMVRAKRPVAAMAKALGLGQKESEQLAITACQGIGWSRRKFTKFLVENTDDGLWAVDDLFRVPSSFLPSKESFVDALDEIYEARGRLTHSGHAFPMSSRLGIGPTMDFRAMNFDWTSRPFPPVVWFERVVNHALNGYVRRSHAGRAQGR